MGRVMDGVVFVFVREDASEAEALAEAFEAAGLAITGAGFESDALFVVIWSRKALRSPAFREVARRALLTRRCVVASFSAPPSAQDVDGAPVIDLSAWSGDDDAGLDSLFEAVEALMQPHVANVIVLPARPTYEDAEFTELAPASDEDERTRRARQSWEAPIPTKMLIPVREAPREKTGAPFPRHDFRRLGVKPRRGRAPATLAFAVIAMLGSGVFAMNALRHDAKEPAGAGVSVALAAADADGLEDAAPPERAEIGRAGLEPPSARHQRPGRG